MQLQRMLRNEKGMALVLAVSMIALLSMFGVWMLVESQTAFRITASMERRQAAFNLSEAALQLDYRCLFDNSLSPSYAKLASTTPPVDILYSELPPPCLAYMASGQSLGRGNFTPTIQYVSYSTTPPPGWMMNWQGSSSFHSLYFRAMGKGTIPLPSDKGNATTEVSNLILKVSR